MRKYNRFAAVCIAAMITFSLMVSMGLPVTSTVMAATTAAEPAESRITNLTTSVVGGVNTVTLNWSKAENTTTYRIYYKEVGGSWELMKSLGSAQTSAVLSSTANHPIEIGVTYYFTVRTYNRNSGKYGLWDKSGVKVCFQAETPGRADIISAVPSVKSGVNSVTLTWSGATNTTNYKIYYKEMGGRWKKIKTLAASKTSATFSSTSTNTFNSGTSYMFTVRSYNSETGKYGPWDKKGTRVSFPAEKVEGKIEVTSIHLLGTDNTSAGLHGLREDNGTIKFGVEVLPANATDKSVRWTSSNPSVATVSSDGTVRMLKSGKTTIGVHANGGDVWARYDLTVIDEEQIALQIVEFTNQERAKEGKAPLINSEFLHEFAMTRAEEISIRFEHKRLDGSGTGYGENIARTSVGVNEVNDAKHVVQLWMNSPGHRTAIMGSDVSIGVGVYIKDGEMFCVQNFCEYDATQTFTLTFDCNGGTGATSIDVSRGQTIYQHDLPVPQRPGYIFKGWALFARAIFKSARITDDMTLTAMWEPIS